jgi:hypothetical protein
VLKGFESGRIKIAAHVALAGWRKMPTEIMATMLFDFGVRVVGQWPSNSPHGSGHLLQRGTRAVVGHCRPLTKI